MPNLNSSSKKFIVVLGLILVAYMILDLNNRVSDLMRLTEDRDTMATQVAELEVTQAYLESQVAYVNSDAAVEKWAREEAFMARSGDHPIMLLPDPGYIPEPTPTPEVTREVLQNWQIWRELFFGQ